MKPMRNVGVLVIIIVVALATIAPDHGGGGGGGAPPGPPPDDAPSSPPDDPNPSSGDVVTGDGTFVETSEAFNESFGTSAPFGETVYTASPEAQASAQDYLKDVDFSALALNPDGPISDDLAQALKDSNYQDLAPDASIYLLQNYQALDGDPTKAGGLLLNIPAQDINADTLKDVWKLASEADYADMSEAQAQKTLAVLSFDTTISVDLGQNPDFLGAVNAIASLGGLVEAETADALGKLLSPDTLADAPFTEQGLENLVASLTDDISDAFLDAAMIITSNFGVGKGEFNLSSIQATVFDTLDYNDVSPIQANPLALQLYG